MKNKAELKDTLIGLAVFTAVAFYYIIKIAVM